MLRNLLKENSGEHRLTSRLEAFSDLVFGFSLSLLATRLDVPTRVEEIFEPTRWLAVIVTFALICRFWLEHYRIFRHHFIVHGFDMVVNFVFLFAIAVLPYSVQTFLRFQLALLPFTLYLSDLCLVLTSLSILRVRGLRQRRENEEDKGRLSDWRRSVAQFAIAGACAVFLYVLHRPGGDFQSDVKAFGEYLLPLIVLILVFVRRAIRQLPSFLRPSQAFFA
ncbi:MAG: TMEM175 family protein [Chthoniobacterales bacterium]